MFYYLHKRDKNHVCYLFNKNSINQNVALVPEKPLKNLDMIRALEIVTDCHQFDPFPPLFDNFTTSTDRVSKKKRNVGFQRPIEATGPWSAWSECSARSQQQVRSQPCEYGRNIQRRQCYGGYLYRGIPITRMSYGPSVEIVISYPPYPYSHPGVSSDEYMRIMSEHSEQMARACCYWKDYFHQQAGARASTVGDGVMAQQPQVQPLEVGAACPLKCPVPSGVQPPVNGQPPVYGRPPSPVPDGVQPKPESTAPPYYGPAPPYKPTPAVPVWASWTEWTTCTATCGLGSMQRYRVCSTGRCEGENVERRTCDQIVPCQAAWAEWSSWSTCHVTCGTGEMKRSRYCYLGEGRCAGNDYEVTKCEAAPCPTWSQWQPWTLCSVTCGFGSRRRMRYCSGDICFGEQYEDSECQEEACPEWSQWQEWSTCSVSCGQGVITRKRVCMGHGCIGESTEQNVCLEQACSIWEEWGEWSMCSATCGFGLSIRERLCHGSSCLGEQVDVKECHIGACTMWSMWQEWSPCSVTCGSGTQHRLRSCVGVNCPGDAEEKQYCETGVSCAQWLTWEEWSRCSRDCGVGERVRGRACAMEDGSAGAKSCIGDEKESAVCLKRLCCEWTTWAGWTPCSHSCGSGRTSRTRMCLRLGYEQDDLTCSGQCYGTDREDNTCNEHIPCPTPPGIPSTEPSSVYRPITERPHYPPPPIPSLKPTYPQPTAPTAPPVTIPPAFPLPKYVRPDPTIPLPVVTQLAPYPQVGTAPTPTAPPRHISAPSIHPLDNCIYPSYVPAPGAPGCISAPVPPSHVLVGEPSKCQWSEWYPWSVCSRACVLDVRRRSRICLGEAGCTCSGNALEELECVIPSACKI